MTETGTAAIVAALTCGSGSCSCAAAARRGWGLVHCPAHDDPGPSLNVGGLNGKLLVKCHAGCPQDAVVDALRERGLWNATGPKTESRRIVATYDYTDERGALLYQEVRYAPKAFAVRRPDGQGGWIWNLEGVRRVPYNLPQVLAAAKAGGRVYVVEGAKDAEALIALGLVATTNALGAGKWIEAYAEALRGALVIIIADKDGPGRAHAQDIVRSCSRMATRVTVLEVPDDRAKDASDWIALGATRTDFERLADAAEWRTTPEPATTPEDPFGEAESSGSTQRAASATVSTSELELDIVTIEEFAAIDEPGASSLLGDENNAVIPENGDLMEYGDGGAGKTTLAIDMGCHLAAGDTWLGIPVLRPVRVLLIENEGPRPLFRTKLRRKLAAWKGSPIEGRVRVLQRPWGALALDNEGRRDALAAAIRRYETDLVVIGPVVRSGMDAAGTLAEVRDFMALIAEVRVRCGRRVAFVLVHHENKGGKVSGAWEGSGDTLLHVQAEGQGRTRVFVQKARWASAYHRTTLQLAWTDGEGFEVVDTPERTDADIEHDLLESALRSGGAGWNKVSRGISGKGERLREIRDRLITDGKLVNAGGERSMMLWNTDDPACPRPLS